MLAEFIKAKKICFIYISTKQLVCSAVCAVVWFGPLWGKFKTQQHLHHEDLLAGVELSCFCSAVMSVILGGKVCWRSIMQSDAMYWLYALLAVVFCENIYNFFLILINYHITLSLVLIKQNTNGCDDDWWLLKL